MNRILAFFSVAPLLLVAACSGAPDSAGSSDSTEADLKSKVCGGIAGLSCPTGYSCEFPANAHPDETGTCKKTPAHKAYSCDMPEPHYPDQSGSCVKDPTGQMCGGFAGIACPSGFVCQMSGASHPDQSGTCAKDATGQMCGGFAGIACPSGFECQMSTPHHPDQAGSCAAK